LIIDYSVLRPSAGVLKAAGVTAAGRYIGWDSVPGHASIGKNISREEAGELRSLGIAVFLAFEYAADAPARGAAQGTADGHLAIRQLADLGAPAGMGVYYAADWDVPDYAPHLPDTPGNALAKLGPVGHYFQAIHAVKPAHQIGGYGGYYVIKRLFDANLITLGWQTIAWSGGQRDHRAQLYQTGATALGGADVNVHEGAAADFGQWPRPHVTTPPAKFHGEYETAGMYSLAGVAAKLGTTSSALLRMTAVHYKSFGDPLAAWLNAVHAGTKPASTPLPAGIRLWVD
jgi:hypothetical protein